MDRSVAAVKGKTDDLTGLCNTRYNRDMRWSAPRGRSAAIIPGPARLSSRQPPEFRRGQLYVGTAEAAAALGVGVSTIKRWVNEGLLPAHRTPGGHRKLLVADVQRFALRRGAPQADLARLDPGAVAAAAGNLPRMLDALTEALRRGDTPAVRHIIHDAYRRARLPIETIADELISPAFARIGHGWAGGELDVLHEHRATQICKAVLFELKAEIDSAAARRRPVAIGGAPEKDHYILPSLLAQMALLDAGWQAINIGPNTPAASFIRGINEFQPKLVWISVSFVADDITLVRDLNRLFAHAQEQGAAMAIGGRALTPELRARICCTESCERLADLVEFAGTLYRRPMRPRRGRPPRNEPS